VPLDDSEMFFPYNLIDIMAVAMGNIDTRIEVLKRPLAVTDLDLSVSVLPASWSPEVDSREMQGKFIPEPTLQQYVIVAQGMVKDFDEERGLKRHSQLARALRVLLYRNPALQVALRAQAITDASGTTERVQDLVQMDQQFLGNEDDEGQFIFLSSLRLRIVTQVQPSI